MVIRISEKQSVATNRLVRKYCCNCINKNCLLLDDGDEHKCVQLISNTGIYCNYFLKSVLPIDKKLIDSIERYNGKKICRNCGQTFISTKSRKRYCGECASAIRKRKAADRVRKYRKKQESNERK